MKLNTSIRKRFRVSNKVKKVASKDRFRLCISRSSKNISAQIIDDINKVTLLSASSVEKDIKSGDKVNKTELSKIVATKLAKKAFFASLVATILESSVLLTLSPDLISFSTEEADNNVTLLISSIICAEIFFDDLEIHSLNLSLEATFLTLLLTLNLFLMLVFSFIIFSFLLF